MTHPGAGGKKKEVQEAKKKKRRHEVQEAKEKIPSTAAKAFIWLCMDGFPGSKTMALLEKI